MELGKEAFDSSEEKVILSKEVLKTLKARDFGNLLWKICSGVSGTVAQELISNSYWGIAKKKVRVVLG